MTSRFNHRPVSPFLEAFSEFDQTPAGPETPFPATLPDFEVSNDDTARAYREERTRKKRSQLSHERALEVWTSSSGDDELDDDELDDDEPDDDEPDDDELDDDELDDDELDDDELDDDELDDDELDDDELDDNELDDDELDDDELDDDELDDDELDDDELDDDELDDDELDDEGTHHRCSCSNKSPNADEWHPTDPSRETGHLFDERFFESSTPSSVSFPSGQTLRVVTGYPEGKGGDYWDPTGSGNPLLDTGPAEKRINLSANFTVGDLVRSGGTSADIARIDPDFVACLQRLRDHVGKPVIVNSGYRSWKRNKRVYRGRKNKDGTPKAPTKSQHCGGRAADIKIAGLSGLEIGKAFVQACGPNVGIGIGKRYAHVDTRGTPAVWRYGGVSRTAERQIRRLQNKGNGNGNTPNAGARVPQGAKQPGIRTSKTLVRFAQTVLNVTAAERLDVDGIMGRQTRAALRRFQTLYALSPSGRIDKETRLALAQRALEELSQQSLFGQLGVPSAKTDEFLTDFKVSRGLNRNARLDEVTLAELANALDGSGRRASDPIPTTAARTLGAASLSSIPGSLGVLRINNSFPALARSIPEYRFTKEDALWMARFLTGESGTANDANGHAVLWAMFNRFGILRHRVRSWNSFASFLRRYSTTLQPILKSVGAARRVWDNHHANPKRFPVQIGTGTYKGTSVRKVQYKKHLDLQKKPWERMAPTTRALVLGILRGDIANPGIGIATEFASTRIYYNKRHGYRSSNTKHFIYSDPGRNSAEKLAKWKKYTIRYASRSCKKDIKGCTWIGERANINQLKNAFFIDNRFKAVPPSAVSIGLD